ncbi:hypothetical protein [Gramella sp. AN32]|uniref:Uncharacterized protein n=1 Tax=Christiangramia antarctica TaxID=2058158 RepID=A0ABW5X3E5_9FLAO|nr:hypothetical protein [Gramella sp. AN32]
MIVFCTLFSSCFKDVDFSEAENIQLTPDLKVSIIEYQLNEIDFTDSETGIFTPVIHDTIRLEYLDDSYVQDGLMYAEFRFKHENTFSFPIGSKIIFLSEENNSQFQVNYTIPAGSDVNPGIIDTLHIMEGEEIKKVRRSINMAIELQILEEPKSLEGELDFSSRGLYRFEF